MSLFFAPIAARNHSFLCVFCSPPDLDLIVVLDLDLVMDVDFNLVVDEDLDLDVDVDLGLDLDVGLALALVVGVNFDVDLAVDERLTRRETSWSR